MAAVSEATRRAQWTRGGIALRTLAQIAFACLALALAVRALYYVGVTFPRIAWPHESTGGEATMLYESALLDRNPLDGLRALYGPQAPDHFIAGNYPPLYIALWALDPGASSFITGRTISLFWGVVAAVAGGVAVWGALRDRGTRLTRGAAAVLGGAAFICTVPVFQQLGIAKPDMMALGLAACGLACFEIAPNRRGAILAGLCFAAALLTKQSVGFALAAAGLASLRRGPRDAVALVVTVAAALGAGLGFLWLLAGPTVFDHLVLYNLRPWRQDRFESLNSKFIRLHWHLVVLGVGYGLWAIRGRGRSALTYYPFLTLVTFYTVGSEGGARNYYLELCLAAGLGAALAVGTLLGSRPTWTLPLGAGLLVVLGVYAVQAYTVFVIGQYVPEPPVAEGGRRNDILARADAAPDPILSDDVSYLAMRGRPAVIDDGFMAEHARREGYWNTAGVVAAIEARRYPLVLTSRSPDDEALRRAWGDVVVDALYANYVRSGPFSFVPQPR